MLSYPLPSYSIVQPACSLYAESIIHLSNGSRKVCMWSQVYPFALAVEQGYSYAGSHEWVKVDGDTATIGISDFAQVRQNYRTYFD